MIRPQRIKQDRNASPPTRFPPLYACPPILASVSPSLKPLACSEILETFSPQSVGLFLVRGLKITGFGG